MKITEVIAALNAIEATHGDIEVRLQTVPIDAEGDHTCSHEGFFIVEEQYEDGFAVNLRTWPY